MPFHSDSLCVDISEGHFREVAVEIAIVHQAHSAEFLIHTLQDQVVGN